MKRLFYAAAALFIGFQSLAATLPLGPGSIFPIGPSVTGSGGAIYYVANGGSDTNNGLSAATAWQTIGKVNGSGLGPNVTVLFNGGQTFSGGLVITQSVSPSNITIASYGAGQATISSGNSAACVSATNVAGVNVSNIICTGGGNATNSTAGISIVNSQAGNIKLAGPTISGNTVSQYGGQNAINVEGTNGTSGFNGVSITNNTVHDVTGNFVTSTHGSNAIMVWSPTAYGTGAASPAHTNVTITGNTVYNSTGTAGSTNYVGGGIFVSQTSVALLANNVVHDFGINNNTVGAGPIGIWTADANAITIQFNEAYYGYTSTTDGDGFDLDGGTTNSVMQYNWSHDNAGWGFLLANYTNSPTLPFSNNTVRFNLGQNNAKTATNTAEVGFYNQANFTGPVYVYNNTFANFRSSIGAAIAMTAGQSGTVTGTIANNVFVGAGGNLVSIPAPSSINFYGNDYYTYGQALNISWNGTGYTSFASWQTATGQEKISGSNVGLTGNPSIYVPGGGFINGGNGYVPANLMAYNLQAGSAMIGAGINLQSQFSINPGTTDFYGAAISNASMPVGAANGDFATFASTCTAATNYLARVSSFSKANNVNYNSLLCGLNSDSNLSLIDALYILSAPNLSASLLNLISASFSLTSHGTTTFTANTGIAGNGSTGYLDTGYVPSTAGGNLTLTSGYAGAYNLTSRAGAANNALFGTNDVADNEEISAYPRNGSNHFFADLNDNSGVTFSSVTSSQGMWSIARSGSTLTSYQNGGQVATGSVAAVALPPVSMFILAQNNNGAAESWTSDQLSAFVIGGGGLDPKSVPRRINSFMQAYGINTY